MALALCLTVTQAVVIVLVLFVVVACFLSVCRCIHKCCTQTNYTSIEQQFPFFMALNESRYLLGPTCRMSYGRHWRMINIQLHGTSSMHSTHPTIHTPTHKHTQRWAGNTFYALFAASQKTLLIAP